MNCKDVFKLKILGYPSLYTCSSGITYKKDENQKQYIAYKKYKSPALMDLTFNKSKDK
jgi:hypothetical protein